MALPKLWDVICALVPLGRKHSCAALHGTETCPGDISSLDAQRMVQGWCWAHLPACSGVAIALWELSLMSGNPSVSISACKFKCSLYFPSIWWWVCSGCHTVVSRLLILCVGVMVSPCSSRNSYHSIKFFLHMFFLRLPLKSRARSCLVLLIVREKNFCEQ